MFSEPQQITEKLLEWAKNNELNCAKLMTFPMFLGLNLKVEYIASEIGPFAT